MKQGLGTGRERLTARGNVVVLPRVWAVGKKKPSGSVGVVRTTIREANVIAWEGKADSSASLRNDKERKPIQGASETHSTAAAEVAFYRKYTEAMLRRYAVMSMEAGRVPSMLGKEMFRGKVTSYRVQGFDDAVIFCHDVEACLKRLSAMEQKLIKRVAVQQYTHGEAALMLGIGLRTCVRHYGEAVDKLTRIFLAVKLMEPLKSVSRG